LYGYGEASRIKPEWGRWRGPGILVDKGYLPVDGRVFYCPSFSYEPFLLDHFDDGNPWPGGGWRPDVQQAIAEEQNHMITSFVYRNYKRYGVGDWRAITISNDTREPILSDMFSFAPRSVSPFQHGGGTYYQFVRLDGSAQGFNDPEYRIRDYHGGNSYHHGSLYVLVDQIWDQYFKTAP